MSEQTEQHLKDPRFSVALRSHPHLHEPDDAEDDSTDSDCSWDDEEGATEENSDDGGEVQSGSEDAQGSAPLLDEPVTQIETESHLLSLQPNATAHPAYCHLDSHCIRLLKISPGEPGSSICIDIEPVSLPNAPEYTAISYAWGSAHASWEIKVNGSKFLVPKNLMRFLEQARSSGGMVSSWLWIDMLSIDQTNSPERAEQVIMMPQIFLQAVRVVVWLGPAYRNSDAAIHAFARPRRYWSSKRRRLQVWASSAGQGVQALCQRPYWQRLWVFQELQMAEERHLMCGSKIVSWDSFEKSILLADDASETHRLDDRTEVIKGSPAMKMIELTKIPGGSTLWSFIKRTKHLRCADVRDRAYALLAVTARAQSKTEVEIIPDYDVPIPAFLNLILRKVYNLFPPKNLEEAQQQCEEVEKVLAVPPGTIYNLENKQGLYEDVNQIDLSVCRLGPRGSALTLWWTHFYGHSSVQRLLLASWSPECWQSHHSSGNHRLNSDETATRSAMAKVLMDAYTMIRSCFPLESTTDDIRSSVFGKLLQPKETRYHHPVDLPTVIADSLYIAILEEDPDLARLFLAPGGLLASLDSQLSAVLLELASKRSFACEAALELENGVVSGFGAFLHELRCPEIKNKIPLLLYSVLAGAHDSVLAILTSKRGDANQLWGGAPKLNHAELSALQLSARLGFAEILRMLLDVGHADVNLTSNGQKSALMFAAAGPSSDCVRLLLEKPECHVEMASISSETALRYAVRAENVDSTRLLLEIGNADINARTGDGETALIQAARRQTPACVRVLLQNDRCEVNMTSRAGRTALAQAVERGNLEIVQLLLAHNANVTTIDSDGKTPLDITESHPYGSGKDEDYFSIRRLLLQAGAKWHKYPQLRSSESTAGRQGDEGSSRSTSIH